MQNEIQILGERLNRLSKTRLKLIDYIEIYSEFSPEKAKTLATKKAMIESLITHYKRNFDLSFGDVQAKNSVYNLKTNNHSVSYHKTGIEKSIEDFKVLIADFIGLNNLDLIAMAIANKPFRDLTRSKRYALQLAFYTLTDKPSLYVKSLEAYEKFKATEKARNAGNLRDNHKINKSKYSNTLDADEEIEIHEKQLFGRLKNS